MLIGRAGRHRYDRRMADQAMRLPDNVASVNGENQPSKRPLPWSPAADVLSIPAAATPKTPVILLTRLGIRVSCGVVLLAITLAVPRSASGAPRNPQWPLKTSPTIYDAEQISRLRKLTSYTSVGRSRRKSCTNHAAYWINIPDEQLRALLPDSRVPRAFNVSTEGCPVHGKAIYQYGAYPWKLDRDHPFSITCPVGGERYPSNDFSAYYLGGMTDPALLIGPYADDGRGWRGPDGTEYWFVAYACHWHWRKTWLPAVTNLSEAYALTGQRIYAHKAIVMLDRIAEIYPDMDCNTQSRLAAQANRPYPGKILNRLWETTTLRDLAVAYDLVFDALIGEEPVSLPWRTASEIRANIETNLLEEGIAAVAQGQISGNSARNALLYAVAVRQHGPTSDVLRQTFNQTGCGRYHEGLNYFLYNQVTKDGLPVQSSPLYCFYAIQSIEKLADALSLLDVDLYEHPRVAQMLDAPLQMLCTGDFTPNIGDSGHITSGWVGPKVETYETAYRHLGKPSYAWALEHLIDRDGTPTPTFEDLLEEPLPRQARFQAASYVHRPQSRVLDGFGWVGLNNSQDSVAVSFYYGPRAAHGHFDRLNLELFGHGHRLSPDLGYPDFMNELIPGIYSWSKNTVSHNCVVVDDHRQDNATGGTLLRFHDCPTIHVADAAAAETYKQTDCYRRTLVQVDMGAEDSYLVDVFRVRGGRRHVLSIHGPEGRFALDGVSLPPPVTEGTLAGGDVAYGALYDDPKLDRPGYKGMYNSYRGSGYQHLFNWQRTVPEGLTVGEWRVHDDPTVRLRVHMPHHAGQELVVADAYVSPTRKIPTILKYVLLCREGDEDGNTFVTVWEPAHGRPLIDRIELHDDASFGTGADRVVALSVHRGPSTDLIAVSPTAGRPFSVGRTLASDAAVVVATERQGQQVRTFAAGGTQVTAGPTGRTLAIPPTITGSINAVDYRENTIRVAADTDGLDPADLVGRTVRIFNERHSCVYGVADTKLVDGDLRLQLAGVDFFTGRVRITECGPRANTVVTNTSVMFSEDKAGMHLLTDDRSASARIVSMKDSVIELEARGAEAFTSRVRTSGQIDTWITDIGLGDRVEIERSVDESSAGSLAWD